MRCCGLDVGSRTIKLVTSEGGVLDSTIVDTGANPLERCRDLLASRTFDRIMVTGYGRYLVTSALGGRTVSEIKAHAVGARYLHPDCRTVIDIGGQDSKVVLLSDEGEVTRFEMNDRCAAGTGRFLEVMANTLEVDIRDFGGLALAASSSVQINSLCTVFAESEVVSLIAQGAERSTIAGALHGAIATRISGMANRVGHRPRVILTGGCALNGCLVKMIRERLGTDTVAASDPQIVGALGAALLAGKESPAGICKPPGNSVS
jgi:predicted CoA-substrate-specific enzyme activase